MSQSLPGERIARRVGWLLAVPILLVAVLVTLSVRSGERQDLVRDLGAHLEVVARSLASQVAGEEHEALAQKVVTAPVARSWAEAPASARRWNERLADFVRRDAAVDLLGTMCWRPDHVAQVARCPEQAAPEALTWVLSSEEQPSFTMREAYLPGMAAPLFENREGRSGIVHCAEECWVQAYAPLRQADGQVVGQFLAGCNVGSRLLAIDLRALGLGLGVLAVLGTAACAVLGLVRRLEREASEQCAAARIRGELLTNAQLQVREPLDGVLGMADLLLDGPLASEEKAGVEIIRNQGHALRDVMQNIVDYADLESGEALALNPASIDLLALCERVVNRYALTALQRRVDVHLCYGAEVPRQFVVDGARIEQILGSVVGNALRFTQCGEVVLEVSCGEAEAGKRQLAFEVQDTGRGIPEDRWDRLFESFQKLEGSLTRRLSSPELGLDIARRVVETLGGSFELESHPGHGSRITITLDVEVEESAAPGASGRNWGQALIVDDRPLARRALREHLASTGLDVVEAYDRESALAMLALSRCQPFKVIVMAQELPDGDAQSVAAVLRRDPGARGVPVIILVSGAVQETQVLDDAGGALGVLTKPIRRSALADLLHRLVPLPETSWLVTDEEKCATNPRRILIGRSGAIDEAVEVRLLLAAGHHVDVAADGFDLVQRFRQCRYDLVFLDAFMSGLDGYAATRALREIERETGRRVPILGLTSQMLAGDRERALAEGMDDYLVRPLGRKSLISAVDRWTAATPEATPPPPSPAMA